MQINNFTTLRTEFKRYAIVECGTVGKFAYCLVVFL